MGGGSGVSATELTNSVSLGSERCLRKTGTADSMCVCAGARVYVRRDDTFDKHEEITMLVLSAGLVPGRGLEASTKCDFLRRAEKPR